MDENSFALGNDLALSWALRVRSTSAPVTGATVTGTATRRGETLWSGSLPESDTPGTYETVIPASAFEDLNGGDVVTYTITTAGAKSVFELTGVWRP